MFDLLIFGFNNRILYSLNVNGKLLNKKVNGKINGVRREGKYLSI